MFTVQLKPKRFSTHNAGSLGLWFKFQPVEARRVFLILELARPIPIPDCNLPFESFTVTNLERGFVKITQRRYMRGGYWPIEFNLHVGWPPSWFPVVLEADVDAILL
jgi:hypothetical protein